MENRYENCNGCYSFMKFKSCSIQMSYKNFSSICPCGKCLVKIKCNTPCELYRMTQSTYKWEEGVRKDK